MDAEIILGLGQCANNRHRRRLMKRLPHAQKTLRNRNAGRCHHAVMRALSLAALGGMLLAAMAVAAMVAAAVR